MIKNYVCYSSLFYAQASFYAQFSLNNNTLLRFCADVRRDDLAGRLLIVLKINRNKKELTHCYSTYGGSRLSALSNLAILGDFSPFRPESLMLKLRKMLISFT